ncbi:biotin holocarboxylase synthetase [Scheffersomyces spartinae]|uniref:Biotin holocarboxylase synthetase n=1 Tax=Scheffersomyces spartinae TaxID=45513 RepID=A0A9P7V680_9ASCO|nr:biotin holocarboxylase synthetase [Scheffersomyces spartinae]KAG7191940.1 biotin holocarboxylase synthetase [Scheffersomyces spartinae]
MNVLVYSGPGTTKESVKHCLETLRLQLSPHYAVVTISEAALINDPWQTKSSCLVMPGGADLPYCEALRGEGIKKINQFVRKGGKYIGFCAGGYFGSSRCEFEVGNPLMEVSGPRELGFFPGVARGCAFKGFVYESHEGAKAPKLAVNKALVSSFPGEFVKNYYNGGATFVDASSFPNVEVLARYTDVLDVESPDNAAIILCQVGKGKALLTGTHPEFSASLLKAAETEKVFKSIISELKDQELESTLFLKGLLEKLGLKINENLEAGIPGLTPIHIVSPLAPERSHSLYKSIQDKVEFVDNAKNSVFEDFTNTFHIYNEASDDSMLDDSNDPADLTDVSVKIYDKGGLPDDRLTPYFNLDKYFHVLASLGGQNIKVGSLLGYGEVVTSTNTLMDSNQTFLENLPHGFTLTASVQVAGKGRGGNVWVNPKGVMATSILFKIPADERQSSSVVTLQYLCGLALIELILGFGSTDSGSGVGYEDIPIRIKWPNDLFVMKPEYFNSIEDGQNTSDTVDGDEQRWVKILGALIKSLYVNKQFHLVWGGGVNVSNEAPTTSLNLVLAKLNEIRAHSGLPSLPPYDHESLLAKLVFTMDSFYEVFARSGLRPFLPLYYKRWFHSDQIVVVQDDAHNSRKCIIKGITPDYGMLVAHDISNNQRLELQPDGNSFDIFKGLVYSKK